MSEYTMRLAALGARVMGLWGFDGTTEPDELVTAVGEAIYQVGLDYGNTNAVREICYQHALDPADYGDEAPAVTGEYPHHELTAIRIAHGRWEDAKAGSGGDAEHAAAGDLIDQLLSLAGLTVTYADGSVR